MKILRYAQVTLLVLAALTFSSFGFGQTATGSITGTVTDSSQAPVNGATVTLMNQATNETRTATTNSSGLYSFQLLPPATYRFEVRMAGFRNFVVSRIPLDVGQAVPQNVSLQLGQQTQTVTVTEPDHKLSLNRRHWEQF